MKLIAKCLGGSRSYGLDTPSSDEDRRFVFLNTELSQIVGLDKHEHQESILNGADDKGKELRRFLNLLKGSNTEAVEILFSSEWIVEPHPLFLELQKNRNELLDSEQMHRCISGYSLGERKLMNGERTGKLGGKRYKNILEFSYSPKNAVQLLRLNWAAAIFFNKGYFPVNVMKEDSAFAKELLDIKINPANHSKEEVYARADVAEAIMNHAFENRNFDFKFYKELADAFVLRFYYPIIQKFYISKWTTFRDI